MMKEKKDLWRNINIRKIVWNEVYGEYGKGRMENGKVEKWNRKNEGKGIWNDEKKLNGSLREKINKKVEENWEEKKDGKRRRKRKERRIGENKEEIVIEGIGGKKWRRRKVKGRVIEGKKGKNEEKEKGGKDEM